MATPFSRTVRSLNADGLQRSAWILFLALAMLGAWLAWFFLAEVTVCEVSEEARTEVDRAVYPLEALIAGRVVATRLTIGREVQAGEALVELETQSQKLGLNEERSRLESMKLQLAALHNQIASENRVREEMRQGAEAGINEARARYAEAEASVRMATEEAERTARLRADGLTSEVEAHRSRIEVQKRQSVAESLQLAIDRQIKDQQARDSGRQALFENFKREVARLEGEIKAKGENIQRLDHDLAEHSIRAPVSGRIGEVADLQIGQIVQASQKLATILPSGDLKIIAEYNPASALGRIRAGQRADLRLSGFSWTEYGKISCQVTQVASEPNENGLRVELSIDQNQVRSIPLQHGLPGRVEIEVDRVSPVRLVLRSVGKLFSKTEAATQRPDHKEEH